MSGSRKKTTIAATVDPDVAAKVKRESERLKKSVSQYIGDILAAHLSKSRCSRCGKVIRCGDFAPYCSSTCVEIVLVTLAVESFVNAARNKTKKEMGF